MRICPTWRMAAFQCSSMLFMSGSAARICARNASRCSGVGSPPRGIRGSWRRISTSCVTKGRFFSSTCTSISCRRVTCSAVSFSSARFRSSRATGPVSRGSKIRPCDGLDRFSGWDGRCASLASGVSSRQKPSNM